jgi:ribosomal protein L32
LRFLGILGHVMVVRMRHTRSHTKNRRSHHKVKDQAIITDKETGVPHLRHRVCEETGMYRGKKVIDTTAKLEKKIAKKA